MVRIENARPGVIVKLINGARTSPEAVDVVVDGLGLYASAVLLAMLRIAVNDGSECNEVHLITVSHHVLSTLTRLTVPMVRSGVAELYQHGYVDGIRQYHPGTRLNGPNGYRIRVNRILATASTLESKTDPFAPTISDYLFEHTDDCGCVHCNWDYALPCSDPTDSFGD